MNIKLRYKLPDSDISKLLVLPVNDQKSSITQASDNLRFAAAVAQFGMLLRNSAYKGNGSFKKIELLAANALQNDTEGYRGEFLELVKKAGNLSKDVVINKE